MLREIVLEFEGYWTEASESFLPDQSGVFCVFRGKHDAENRRVHLRELIYIGESERVRRRVKGHEKKPDWRRHLNRDETLCYSFAPILHDRNRAEAALIHEHKPAENYEHAYDFEYPDTAMFLTGKTLLMSACFAVLETHEVGWNEAGIST